MERTFRGMVYKINVARGADKIKVDGNLIEGTVLPLFDDGQVHAYMQSSPR
jgi:cellobiose phosphorylase